MKELKISASRGSIWFGYQTYKTNKITYNSEIHFIFKKKNRIFIIIIIIIIINQNKKKKDSRIFILIKSYFFWISSSSNFCFFVIHFLINIIYHHRYHGYFFCVTPYRACVCVCVTAIFFILSQIIITYKEKYSVKHDWKQNSWKFYKCWPFFISIITITIIDHWSNNIQIRLLEKKGNDEI